MKYIIGSLLLAPLFLTAQKPIASYGMQLSTGSIYVHTRNVENVRGAKPNAIHIEFAKQYVDSLHYHAAKANVRAGWQIGYENFGTAILGNSVQALRFIEPNYFITPNLHFNLRGKIGLGYFSSPNQRSKNNNPSNNSYSTSFIPIMGLALGFQYIVTPHWQINTQAGFTHSSNGGFRFPNRGINWFQYTAGINYSIDAIRLKRFKKSKDTSSYKHWFADAGIWFVPGQQYNSKWNASRNFAIGANFQLYRTMSRINAITFGTDIYYNDISLAAPSSTDNHPLAIGLHGGNAFLLGRIEFSQQFGWNVVNGYKFLSDTYTRFGFTYRASKKIRIGAFLKANSDEADLVGTQLYFRL
jgi:hypothetical protein